MLDRLISGAGAVTDGADRSVRSLASGSRREYAATRPGSVLIAAILVVLATLLVLAGVEATDPSTPVHLAPGDVEGTRALPDRTYATISGSVDTIYVETYGDDNGNDVEDPGETGIAWYYWLVDPTDRQGVTVLSTRAPTEVLTFDGRGIVRSTTGYLTEDYAGFLDELGRSGVVLAPGTLIDTTAGADGPVTTVDLTGAIPAVDQPVEVSGSRLGEYLGVCTTDPNADGRCEPGEEDRYEIVVFDPVSKRGVPVLVRDPPEFAAVTMTGLLRREERTVDHARSVDGLAFGDLDLQVSDRYVLVEPAVPESAPLAFALAAVLVAIALAIAVGLAGGYLVYRRSTGALPAAAITLAAGERIPLRITGTILTPTGRLHVRDVPGDLVRFVLGHPVTTAEPADGASDPAAPVSTTVVVERTGYPQGVGLGRSELRRLSAGRVMAFRGPRPAIRVAAGTGPLCLSFASEADRDRAAAELLAEAGLGADGRHPAAS